MESNRDGQDLRAVVGENARQLRQRAGLLQDQLLSSLRHLGLSWSQARLWELESGRKSVSASELLVLALALNDAGAGPVTVADLVAGDGAVALTPSLTVHRATASRMLAGASAVLDPDTDVPGGAAAYERVQAAEELRDADGLDELRERVEVLARPSVRGRRRAKAERDATFEAVWFAPESAGSAEVKAARALGVSLHDLAALAIGLWGRSLTAERDRRARQGSTAKQRGWVTRGLLDELRDRRDERLPLLNNKIIGG